MNNPLLIQITNQYIDLYLDEFSHSSYELAMGHGIKQHNSVGSGCSANSPTHLAYLARYIHTQLHVIHYAQVNDVVYIGSSGPDLVCKLAYIGTKLSDFHLHKVNSTVFTFNSGEFYSDVAESHALDQWEVDRLNRDDWPSYVDGDSASTYKERQDD